VQQNSKLEEVIPVFLTMDLSLFTPEAQAKMMELFAVHLLEQNAAKDKVTVQQVAESAVTPLSKNSFASAAVTPSNEQEQVDSQDTADDGCMRDISGGGDEEAEVSPVNRSLNDRDRCKFVRMLSTYNRTVIDNKRLNSHFSKVQLPHVVAKLENVNRTKANVDANAPFLNELIR
jgi:hypothetical protein